MKGRVILKYAPLLLAISGSIAAQERDLFKLSLDELLSIQVVTNSKREQKLSDTPRAFYVLTQEDIQSSGAAVLPEVLRLVPGVQVAQITAHRWAISIRGFQEEFSNKLLILIDGKTAYTPVFSGVFWDANDINLSEIERIEILRGPGSVVWGANAVNGVINIITRNAHDTAGEFNSRVMVSSPQLTTIEAYYGSSVDTWAWRTSLRHLSQNDSERPSYSINAVEQSSAFDSWESTRLSTRADKQGSNKLTISTDIYEADIGDVLLNVPFISPIRVEDFYGQGSLSGFHAAFNWSTELNDSTTLLSHLFYTDDERDSLNSMIQQSTLDWEIQYNAVNDDHSFTIGGGARRYKDTLLPSRHVYFEPESSERDIFNVFAYDQWQVSESSKIIFGLKVEKFEQLDTEVHPKIGWRFQNQTYSVWANIERAVRTPNRLDRNIRVNVAPIPADQFFPGQPEGFVQLRGNPDIQVESLIAYEFGLRHTVSESFNWDLSSFVYDYDDLVLLQRSGSFDAGFVDQDGRFILPLPTNHNSYGKTQGMELSLNWQANGYSRISAFISLLDMNLKGSAAADIANKRSPKYQFQLRSLNKFGNDWTLSTMLYITDAISNESSKVDSVSKLDVRVAHKSSEQLEWFFGARSLLDDKHFEHFSQGLNVNAYVERQVYLGFNYRQH